ncbi:MAG: POTRA domain-containing protein [Terriglobales bacterium]
MPISVQDEIAALIKQRTFGSSLDGVTDESVERVRARWQDYGYVKAKVTGEETTLASSPVGRNIALNFHVDEGSQYRLDGITFKNNKAMGDVSKLRGLFPINDGDIFSREKIATGLQNLSKAYGKIGYINFTSIPDSKFDDEKKLISLDIGIDEGKQFYVSSINVLGLDEQARQELLKELPIKRGQVYNSEVREFLPKYGFNLPDCGCDGERRLNYHTGAVAITLDFRPCSAD